MRLHNLFARLMGLLSLALGTMVLLGWHTHNLALLRIHPSFVAMAYNTALGFFFCGVGLLGASWNRRLLTFFGGGASLLCGSLTLGEYLCRRDFHIDELFIKAYLTSGIVHPTRMAFNTALCFTLLGTVLLIQGLSPKSSRSSFVMALLGAIVVGLGAIALSGYFIGISSFYTWGHFTRMAVHTALGFIGLGAGSVALAWHQSAQEGRSAARWLPAVFGVGTLTGTLCLWQALIVEQGVEIQWLHRIAGVTTLPASLLRLQLFVPQTALAVGLLVSALLSRAAYLAQTGRRRAEKLEEANLALHQEVAQRRAAETALNAETDRQAMVITTQQEIAGAEHDLDMVLQIIVARTQELTQADAGVVEMVEDEEMVYRSTSGTATPYLGLRLAIAGSLSGRCVREDIILRCDDTESDPRVNKEACRRIGIRSMILVPLHRERATIGALKVLSARPNAFTERDIASLQLMAGVISAAIGDAVAFETRQALLAERAQAMDAIQQSERFMSAILDVAGALVVVQDTGGRIVRFNRACEQTTGWTLAEVAGKQAWDVLLLPEEAAGAQEAFSVLCAGEFPNTYENHWATRDGGSRLISWSNTALLREDGSVEYIIGTGIDITERKKAEQQLQASHEWLVDANTRLEEYLTQIQDQAVELEVQKMELEDANAQMEATNAHLASLATTDGLTGLKNHRTFQERLQQEFQRSSRYQAPLSVVLLDVDQFKQFNDAYGHPAGDAVLRQVAQILEATARTTDITARYGGEEFVVLLPETGAEDALLAAERFRVAIEAADWENRQVTASFGIATLNAATLEGSTLIEKADRALYISKHRGRNCVTHSCRLGDFPTPEENADPMQVYMPLVQEMLDLQSDTLATASERIKESLQQAYDATVESWSRLLDMRDRETEGHSERVTALTVGLAQTIGMTEEEILYAKWGAHLHDIGKIGVPDRILLKPAPLSEEEWIVMRRHPVIAFEMLSPVLFLGPALDIPYCHHEKWDGSGYPRGLKGDEIPLSARLFALADVYDALKSDRPYRPGWPEEEVCRYILSQSGKHFDPRAVDLFLENMTRVQSIPKAA